MALICLGLRFKHGGIGAVAGNCILSTEMTLLMVLYGAYGLGGLLCLVMLRNMDRQASSSSNLEFYLMYSWGLATVGPFIGANFSEATYASFSSHVFPPEILIVLFNLGPVVISLCLPPVARRFGICTYLRMSQAK
jgi:hypothetical protein